MSIFAHPDDETFSAGGMLAKYGKKAYAVCVTFDKSREEEFRKACDILGINFVQLTFKEVAQSLFSDIKTELMDILRLHRPDHVITHLENDYHFEHRLVREIVIEAVEWVSHTTSANVIAHQIKTLWGAETTVLISNPEIYIDISDQHEKQMRAIEVYDSQKHKGGTGFYKQFHSKKTELRGIQAGVSFAEAYVSIPIIRTGAFKPIKVLSSFDDL